MFLLKLICSSFFLKMFHLFNSFSLSDLLITFKRKEKLGIIYIVLVNIRDFGFSWSYISPEFNITQLLIDHKDNNTTFSYGQKALSYLRYHVYACLFVILLKSCFCRCIINFFTFKVVPRFPLKSKKLDLSFSL
jgi:hypothetical protein